MGASESKLVFKQGIFRLSEDQAIPAGDPYWTGVSGRFLASVKSLIVP
jgi:High-temperature-induced dauer-formation protein